MVIIMAVSKTNIKIEPSIFKVISQRAKNEGTTEDKIINDILKKEVETNETAIERIERLTDGKAEIANKDTYNPDPINADSMKGIIEGHEDFDIVKAVHDVKVGKWD